MERADLLYSGLMFAAGMLSTLDRCFCSPPPSLLWRRRCQKIRTRRCYNLIYIP